MTQHDKYADLSRLPIAEAEAFLAGMRVALDIGLDAISMPDDAWLIEKHGRVMASVEVFRAINEALVARGGKKP
jgi:hypothetical protein